MSINFPNAAVAAAELQLYLDQEQMQKQKTQLDKDQTALSEAQKKEAQETDPTMKKLDEALVEACQMKVAMDLGKMSLIAVDEAHQEKIIQSGGESLSSKA